MNKLTVVILTLALTGSVAFAQGGRGGMGGNRGGNRGGNQGGPAAQNQNGGVDGAAMGGMGQQGGFGGFGGQQGGGRGGRGGFGGQQGGGRGGRGGFGGQQGGFGGFGADMEGMEGGFGGMGGFGQQGGFGGMGGMDFGGMGQQGGFGGFGGQQGGFGGMGGMDFGGMGGRGGMGPGGMGGNRGGQLQQTIDRLKAETPREQALKKMEAADKEAYARILKGIDDVNAQLAALAQKAEVTLPDTTEQQKAKTLEFLTREKDAIDKLLETDKTDSAAAMRGFNELAQKNQITIAPDFGRGGANVSQPNVQSGTRGSNNVIRQIQEKLPEEYKEAEKLRESDPPAYRKKMFELKDKLNSRK